MAISSNKPIFSVSYKLHFPQKKSKVDHFEILQIIGPMKVQPCNDSPWIHFIPIRRRDSTVYINPYQVVAVKVQNDDDMDDAVVEFEISNGTQYIMKGEEAFNAARVFSGLGIIACIAEDAREGRDDEAGEKNGG